MYVDVCLSAATGLLRLTTTTTLLRDTLPCLLITRSRRVHSHSALRQPRAGQTPRRRRMGSRLSLQLSPSRSVSSAQHICESMADKVSPSPSFLESTPSATRALVRGLSGSGGPGHPVCRALRIVIYLSMEPFAMLASPRWTCQNLCGAHRLRHDMCRPAHAAKLVLMEP